MSIDHALEHVMQIGAGLDVVHLAGLDDRTERCPPLSADIRARKEVVLSSKSNGTNCPLNRIGIELDAAVLQELRESLPARQRVADGISELATRRHAGELLL